MTDHLRATEFFASVTAVLVLALPAATGAPVETAGIGVALRQEGDDFFIRALLPETPAGLSKSVHVNDRIAAVGQGNEAPTPIKGRTMDEVVRLIRGPKGTTVRLTIVPAGQDESLASVVSFVRGEIKALAKWGDGMRLTPGTKAPDIELQALSGETRERLSDHAGRIIVIDFWATWCGPCQKVVSELQELGKKHPTWKDKVLIITASVDDDRAIALAHLTERGWTSTHNVWVDVDAVKSFHVGSLPMTYVMDAAGNIAPGEPEETIATIVDRLLQGK